MQWAPELCGAWLSCFARRGDWRAAEDAWRSMRRRGVALDGDAHCKLMQIYTNSGEVEQLAKIEPLYAQMQSSSSSSGSGSAESSRPPLHFTLSHFEELIKTAHHAVAPAGSSAASRLAGRSA